MEIKPKLKHIVIGIHMPDRVKQAHEVQKILVEYSCSIRSRIGLHEVNDEYCSSDGLLILEMFVKEEEMDAMVSKLKAVSGIDTQCMVFDHHKK